MTKQEVRQESKNNDGDPLIKGRRRQLQAELSRNRTLATVADSTVVIVNPVHFAVALKYEAGEVLSPHELRKVKPLKFVTRRSLRVSPSSNAPLARHLHKKPGGIPHPCRKLCRCCRCVGVRQQLGNKKGLPVIHRLDADTVGMSNDESTFIQRTHRHYSRLVRDVRSMRLECCHSATEKRSRSGSFSCTS